MIMPVSYAFTSVSVDNIADLKAYSDNYPDSLYELDIFTSMLNLSISVHSRQCRDYLWEQNPFPVETVFLHQKHLTPDFIAFFVCKLGVSAMLDIAPERYKERILDGLK